jgi:chemotaxis response regulator CheB
MQNIPVLIVDDSAVMRKIVDRCLRQAFSPDSVKTQILTLLEGRP